MTLDSRIYVGLVFQHYFRSHHNVYTVVDIHTTRNVASELVLIEVVCQREFMGQTLTSKEPQATVIRSLLMHGDLTQGSA